jgi:hypothetical protein
MVQIYQLMGNSELLMPVCARTRRLTLAKLSDVITDKRRYCSLCVCVCVKGAILLNAELSSASVCTHAMCVLYTRISFKMSGNLLLWMDMKSSY